MGLSLIDGVDRITILDLSYACLQVVQSQVADLVFETIEIHCDGFVSKGNSMLLVTGKKEQKVSPWSSSHRLTSQNRR